MRLTAGSGGGAQRVHLVAVGDELRLRDESLARAAGARERRRLLPPPILVNFVPKQPLRPVVLARSASSAVVAAAVGGAIDQADVERRNLFEQLAGLATLLPSPIKLLLDLAKR